MKGAEAWIFMQFAQFFFHGDFEAVAAWIRISFSQEPFKRMWVGVKGSFDVFGYLRGPHEEFEKVVLMFWGHVNFTTRIRKWKHSPYPVLDNPNPYPKVWERTDFAFTTPSTGVLLPATEFPSPLHAPPLIMLELEFFGFHIFYRENGLACLENFSDLKSIAGTKSYGCRKVRHFPTF